MLKTIDSKQLFIIRQSSAKTAFEYIKDKPGLSTKDGFALADAIVDFCLKPLK